MDEAEWMDGWEIGSLSRHSQINHIDRRTCGGALLQTVNALAMVIVQCKLGGASLRGCGGGVVVDVTQQVASSGTHYRVLKRNAPLEKEGK